MQKITDNVYVQLGVGACNHSFVVTSDGVVAIDTPVSTSASREWAKEIAKHGPLRYLINGEGHPDHIAGNCYLGGILIAHEGARKAILETDIKTITDMQQRAAPGAPRDPDFKLRPPDITLSDRLTIYLGKHTFHLYALPGHSPNQVSVYVPEEKVIFTSDNVVTSMPFFREAVAYEWIQSLEFIDKLDFNKVVVGHGEVQDKNYVRQMINKLQAWINAVTDAMNKGMTLEETQKKIAASEEFAAYAKNSVIPGMFKTSVAGLYNYLKKKK
jgi:glyoxylase-like metal-dependent hydrolase (beta-lactamase superfamily II)